MENTILPGAANQIPVELLAGSGTRLQQKITAAGNKPVDQRKSDLREAAQEFEAIFIAYMLKVMRETIEESGLTDGGPGKAIYTELFDQQISRSLASRGALGLSDLLYDNLVESAAHSRESMESPG
ncbi:MAG: rod-binding protein [Acidobacteria bacterium]|nr:rod-binding protein [Acidobacteriota bacterium]